MLHMRGLVIVSIAAFSAGCASDAMREPVREPVPPVSGTSPDRAREAAVYALTLIGMPYRNGGTSPESGFDCSGLVWFVYRRAAGVTLPRSANEMGRAGRPVAAEALRPGDLVFYNTLGRDFSHVGIYIGDQRFVHAPSSGGTVEIVSMGNSYWSRRYSGARRIVS
jgi:cell wall-associated NlpC family hydrolase